MGLLFMYHGVMVARPLTNALYKTDFLNCVEPYDQIMAERRFEIREELLLRIASLCIPPSRKAGMQMVAGDLRETSQIANVRVYVEQAGG